jgi:ribonuclease P protein component
MAEAGGGRGGDGRFRRRDRLLRRREFQRCYREGRREHGVAAVLHAAPSADGAAASPRLGITASRKVGSAVVRNRIRRWVREAFRRSPGRERLAGLDLVVHLKPEAAHLTHRQVSEDVERLLRRIERRWAAAGSAGGRS